MNDYLFWGVIIIGAMVYAAVAAIHFVNFMFEDSMAEAFGWPGGGLLSCLISSVLWPILLPLGLILSWWEARNHAS